MLGNPRKLPEDLEKPEKTQISGFESELAVVPYSLDFFYALQPTQSRVFVMLIM